MWKCPICGNEEKSKYVCRKCGYDTRKDFVRWRTVCEVPEADVQERIRLKSGVWNENFSKKSDTKKKEEPGKKSALGFKMPIPVMGFVLIALIAVFIVMGKDKNRIQSAGVTYEDDLDDLCVLGSDIKRSEIRRIAFLDSKKEIPEDAWDVSEKQDGSVMAWLEDGDSLYFAADGLIKANEDSSYFFAGYTNVEEICYNGAFDTSDVTDMTGMFTECHNLRNCGIDALDTSKVTDMSLMFCNIDNWKSFMHELDTRNVTDMSYMFAECDSLESVSINGLDTRKVTDTTAMFYNCPKLSRVSDLEDWDLSQVTQDADMFIGCSNLSADVYEGIWERHTEIEKNMLNVDFEDKLEYERYDDVKLQTKKITFLDTLENVPKYAVDVSEHQDGSVMAWYEEKREHLIIAADGPVVANPENADLFEGYENVEEIHFNQAFDTSRMTNMSFMFNRCLKLREVDLNGFDTSNVTDMSSMFAHCSSLEALDLSRFDTSNVTDMSKMFYRCVALKELDMSSFKITDQVNTEEMFAFCDELSTEADDSASKRNMLVADMGHTYLNGSIPRINVPNIKEKITKITFLDSLENMPNDAWDVSENEDRSVVAWIEDGEHLIFAANGQVVANPDSDGMFSQYEEVTEINFNQAFDTSQVTDMSYMFWCCFKLEQLNLSSLDTSNVTNMYRMFAGCHALTALNVSSLDTSNVTNMHGMFGECYAIESLDISNFDTSQVTDMSGMFSRCETLESLDVSHFDMTNVQSTDRMFEGCNRLSPEVYSGIWDGN